MGTMFVRHEVSDFTSWKPFFDDHAAFRKEHGITDISIHQEVDDPNDVTIVFEYDDLAEAQRFTQSDELREVMQEAGVLGKPNIWFTRR